MSVGHILYILVPIFFVIILGWLAGHYKSFDASSSKTLNALVTKFALPAHLFIGITTTDRKALIEQWPFLLALVPLVGVILTLFGFHSPDLLDKSCEGSSARFLPGFSSRCYDFYPF